MAWNKNNSKNIPVIYKITNLINGKFYIGSTLKFYDRVYGHKSSAKSQTHHNAILQRAFNKYGLENFIFEIVKICHEEELIECEQWFVDNLKPDYNVRKIVDRSSGIKMSQDIKDKLSRIQQERKHLQRKFNKTDVDNILLLRKQGLKNKEIGDIYDIHPEDVSKICNGLKYSDLSGIVRN